MRAPVCEKPKWGSARASWPVQGQHHPRDLIVDAGGKGDFHVSCRLVPDIAILAARRTKLRHEIGFVVIPFQESDPPFIAPLCVCHTRPPARCAASLPAPPRTARRRTPTEPIPLRPAINRTFV